MIEIYVQMTTAVAEDSAGVEGEEEEAAAGGADEGATAIGMGGPCAVAGESSAPFYFDAYLGRVVVLCYKS